MPQRRSDKSITPKQIKFVYAYLSNGCNGYQAAREAGHSHASARGNSHKYLQNPIVRKFMNKQLKKIEDELGADFMWKLQKLKHIINLCAPDQAEHKDEINAIAAISGIGEMNKMQGHHAAEKYKVAVSEDKDMKEGGEIVAQMLKEREKEY